MTETGQTLGRFVLVREIARSNDIVWEAIDPQVGRRVAVKELSLAPTLTGQARRERIERFYREARAAGAMSHSNIVTIYDIGDDQGRYYIAMEYLDGQTLRDRLSMVGALPLNEALDIAIALTDSLEYAHARGVIHRDIKPDNVFLLNGMEGRARVKLTDFGIARITHESQLTVAGQVFGTPSYMSPEQVLGKEIDTRSDLFSLGILLYEMVTGRKPFTGDSVVTITYRIMNDPTPPVVGAPPILESIIQRATAKDPGLRYGTAAELRAALLAAQSAGGRASIRPDQGLTAPHLRNAAANSPHIPNTVYGNTAGVSQSTALYGAQTQYAAAPQQPGIPLSPPAVAPYNPPTSNTARNLGVTALVVVIVGGIILGGGLALSKAFKNYSQQDMAAATSGDYNKGAQFYQTGKYEEAAAVFRKLRTAPGTALDIVQKSKQGEVYAYRQLGHRAQDQNDLAAAEKWFQAALDVDPNDPQAKSELDAIRRARTAQAGGTAPASTPPPSANLEATPPPSLPGTASQGTGGNISSQQFFNNTNQAASDAATLLTQGDEAWRSGNKDAARNFWRKAQTAGPGTSAFNQAGNRLERDFENQDPLGGQQQ